VTSSQSRLLSCVWLSDRVVIRVCKTIHIQKCQSSNSLAGWSVIASGDFFALFESGESPTLFDLAKIMGQFVFIVARLEDTPRILTCVMKKFPVVERMGGNRKDKVDFFMRVIWLVFLIGVMPATLSYLEAIFPVVIRSTRERLGGVWKDKLIGIAFVAGQTEMTIRAQRHTAEIGMVVMQMVGKMF
jgi:hypothetical protein